MGSEMCIRDSSIGAQYSLNSLDIKNSSIDYSSIDAILKYNLIEGDFLPYLFGGYGLSSFNKDSDADGMFPSVGAGRTILGGVGLNYSISDKLAINASTSYRSSSEKATYNHLQHVVGFSYVFGAQDTDNDGVSDKKDICPEVPGLKEFEGCPDTDGDGIGDCVDNCPNVLNPNQEDMDLDGEGDVCDEDIDGDGFLNTEEEECGSDPRDINSIPEDKDGDGICDGKDICPDNPNPDQEDMDLNGEGDVCDDDIDGDSWLNEVEEKCGTDPRNPSSYPKDRDGDGIASCEDPDDGEIYVSPLLTPGVNGPEATWQVKHIEQYGTSSVKVYNRNGQLVFSKRNYQNDWGGTYQETGELLPAGSYYYLVEVKETGKVKKGWLSVSYTHLRAHETPELLGCRVLL